MKITKATKNEYIAGFTGAEMTAYTFYFSGRIEDQVLLYFPSGYTLSDVCQAMLDYANEGNNGSCN